MSATLAPVPRRPDWLHSALLILLTLVPAIAGTMRLVELASGAAVTDANARFFAAPLPVVVHILTVIPYGILGALQFAPGFRRRHRTWHRNAGKALLVLGLVAAASGIWMTLTYPWPSGDGAALYVERLVFGSLMLFSLVRAALAIPHHQYVSHGEWMTRAYAIGLGAGTQVLTHLPWLLWPALHTLGWRTLFMGLGWAINLAAAEWLIARARHSPRLSAAR